MTLSMATGIRRMREVITEITALTNVYSAEADDERGIPDTLQDFPAVLVFPGETIEYTANNQWETHTYEVNVQVMQAGPDPASRSATVLPLVDSIINKFRTNVSLGGRVAYAVFRRQTGFVKLEYGGEEYEGYQITIEVRESGAATDIAVGN